MHYFITAYWWWMTRYNVSVLYDTSIGIESPDNDAQIKP